MFILKILFAPLSLILSLFVWLCAGLLSCSGFVFKLASGLLFLLAFAVLITYSVKNGIILLVLAFLISPMGLPMLAVQGLGNTDFQNLRGFDDPIVLLKKQVKPFIGGHVITSFLLILYPRLARK